AGWRPGRAWGLLAAGMTLNAAADVITALEVAAGTDDLAALAGGLWALAFVFVGLAAWQRPRTVAGHYDGWAAIALPAVFAVAAIGLLVHGNAADVPPAATGLALAAIASAFVRTMLSFREI